MVVDRLAQVHDDPLAQLVDEIDAQRRGQGEQRRRGGRDQEAGQKGVGGVHLEAVVDQPARGHGDAEGRRRGQHDEEYAQQGVDRVGLEIGAKLAEGTQVLAAHALAGGGLERLLEELAGAWPAGGGGRGDLRTDHASAPRWSPVLAAPVLK